MATTDHAYTPAWTELEGYPGGWSHDSVSFNYLEGSMELESTEGTAATRDARQRKIGSGSVADKDNRQWTIKGLPPSTVEITREAAKLSGMKLNSFINQALERAATEVACGVTENAQAASPNDLAALKQELARVQARADQLESTVASINALLVKLCANQL